MSGHCLICNFPLIQNDKIFSVFGSVVCSFNKEDNVIFQKKSLLEVIGQILNRPLETLLLHSQEICQGCHLRVVEYVVMQDKLNKLQEDLTTTFDQTAVSCTDINNLNVISHSLTEAPNNIKTEGDYCLRNNLNQLTGVELEGDTSAHEVKSPEIEETKFSIKLESPDPSDLQVNDKDNPNESRNHACEKCGKTFITNSHLVDHMVIHTDAKLYMCSHCARPFKTLSALKVHERWHLGVKPFQCDKCDRSFAEKHRLNEHLQIHSGEKAFKCLVCSRAFSRKKDLNSHIKIHSEDRPFSCTYCGKTFVDRSRLNRHAKIHDSNKPHQCPTCPKSFVRLADFKIHERLHTGVRPFKCPTCEKCFNSRSNLRSHERRHKAINSDGINGEIAADNIAEESSARLQPPDSPTTPRKLPKLERNTSDENSSDAPGKEISQSQEEVIPSTGPTLVSVASSSQAHDKENSFSERAIPLATFPTMSNNKSVIASESTLPLNANLANVQIPLSTDGNGQQSVVLMQLPVSMSMSQEPPPLLLYTTPRHANSAAQLVNSMLTDGSSDININNQLQVLRWDNLQDVENINLYQDNNSNGSILAHNMF